MTASEPTGLLRSSAPGRVNLLGEHLDYNDGPVLPAAIDRRVTLTARPTGDRVVWLEATDLHQRTSFRLDRIGSKLTADGDPLPGWALYPAGVAWALLSSDLAVTGLQASFTSNVPMGSGLSSSAAVEVAFAALWQVLGGWSATRLELAKLCRLAEAEYVGVNCGLMDQFASTSGVAEHALYFDTRSLTCEAIPLPPESAIIVADSTLRRSLSNSAYNERRAQCEQAVRLLQTRLPGIRALRDVSPEELEHYADRLPSVILKRARHVVGEIQRVEQAVEQLKHSDAAGFGRLMVAGHASLRDLYEVSLPELDALVEIAAGMPGCWGARLSGAGFGGCTVNLVERGSAESFMVGLRQGYRKATGLDAPVYLCRASAGVEVTTGSSA